MYNAISTPIRRTLAVCATLFLAGLSTLAVGQQAPRLVAKFANPVYDATQRTYSVDVMLTSLNAEEVFYGMNLRFFYDASRLEYKGIDQYAPGTGYIHEAPRASVGTDVSGVQLLGLDRAAGHVNGGVEAKDERYPVVLKPGAWTKLCRANFSVPLAFQDEVEFCPALVWDKMPFLDGGGLLGNDGVVIAVREDNRDTRADSRRAIVEGEPLNWQYRRATGMPYGEPKHETCVMTAQTTSTGGPTTADGYALYQNQPNPFDEQTRIDFDLPYAQQAKLFLYTVDGEQLEMIDGYYPAGRNSVLLQRKPWMARTGMVYYQLVAGDNVTLVRKMNLVNR
jgi:hypothetical protein